jgi:hypothetical protein
MKTRISIVASIALALGFVAGVGVRALLHPANPTTGMSMDKDFFTLLPSQEAGRAIDWSEYRKGDWHIAVAWVQDATNHEARVYAFVKRTNDWKLVETEKLSHSQDLLDHVLVNYPDRNVMLVNDQSLLIHSLLLGEAESTARLGSSSSTNKLAVSRTNGE